jgi:hypothetical protein
MQYSHILFPVEAVSTSSSTRQQTAQFIKPDAGRHFRVVHYRC